jgi:hypothetical protein
MVRPLGHQLILDFNGFEAGRLAHANRAMHVHGSGRLTHLGQVEIGFKHNLLIAAEIARPKSRAVTGSGPSRFDFSDMSETSSRGSGFLRVRAPSG